MARARKPKTLQEFVQLPMSRERNLQLADAIIEHAFDVRVYRRTWQVFRFTLFGEVGTYADFQWQDSGWLYFRQAMWAGQLSKTEVTRRIRAEQATDPALR